MRISFLLQNGIYLIYVHLIVIAIRFRLLLEMLIRFELREKSEENMQRFYYIFIII